MDKLIKDCIGDGVFTNIVMPVKFNVSIMCTVLKVKRSGYYGWIKSQEKPNKDKEPNFFNLINAFTDNLECVFNACHG